jgi:hypothetical protein
MIDDAEHAWWLHTACGLVRLAQSELDAWTAAVDAGKAPRRIVTTVLDSSDGVRAVSSMGSFTPYAARSGDGKLWYVTRHGVTVIDPRDLRLNKLPPPVHVEGIVADRKPYEASSGVRLPPLVRDLAIEYTATSLVAPEKMQFRYKLEGRDRDWHDAGNRRQAFYTDLDPGDYRSISRSRRRTGRRPGSARCAWRRSPYCCGRWTGCGCGGWRGSSMRRSRRA